MANWDPNFGSYDPGGRASYPGNIPVYTYNYQNFIPANQYMQNYSVPQTMYTVDEIERTQKRQYSRNQAQSFVPTQNNTAESTATAPQLTSYVPSSGASSSFNLNVTAAEFKPMENVPTSVAAATSKTIPSSNHTGAVKKTYNEKSGSKFSNKRNDNSYNRRYDRSNRQKENSNNQNDSKADARSYNRQDRPKNEYFNSNYEQNGYKPSAGGSSSSSSTRNNDNQESGPKTRHDQNGYIKPNPLIFRSKRNDNSEKNSKPWNKGKNWESKRNGNNGFHDKLQDKFRRNNKPSRNEDREVENWRSQAVSNSGNRTEKNSDAGSKSKEHFINNERTYSKQNSSKDYNKKVDAASQRERLTQQIERNLLECLVCCERVRKTETVWNCRQCFHVLHLACVSKWAKSSRVDDTWRCPACQFVCKDQPCEYLCFCGSITSPPPNTGHLAHSCGELCSRKPRPGCKHACTLLCHPGPCPECNAIVNKPCGCGRTTVVVKCSDRKDIRCGAECEKPLNCTKHKCTSKCHPGECETCDHKVVQSCYCGKNEREVVCDVDVNEDDKYECGDACGKKLSCGNHFCDKTCHSGPCDECKTAPDLIRTCPCGQTPLKEPRTSCLDPIICCDKICNKKLRCGQPSEPHQCLVKCHEGACPPCKKTTFVRCRCGHMDRELPCNRVTTAADDARCEKKCTKKRLCGKHKCNQFCCIDLDHECPLPCNHLLSCGIHRCERTCHRGRCLTCDQTSFEELYCECGASVIYPPVPCGTRRPACKEMCSREHPCNHAPQHTCHSMPECPPCTILTTKLCHGEHESRSTIPCHQQHFSCGMPCNKESSCGKHKCVAICHLGPCPQPCTQPCETPRSTCGHICAQRCHEGPCPETPCKQTVRVTCECGHRSSSRVCSELAGEYQRIATSLLASKMAEMQRGHSVDINDIIATPAQRRQSALKTLDCNDECRIIERNRRLAIGLQIRNPDLSAKLTPRYSEFMRQWAKKDPRFCAMVHDKLTELVQLAKQSKQKSRSYSFQCMNRDKRHFVHEYCEHFGCESAAYDQEPNRNVVATAVKDKAWLPAVSLLELIQRENGQRKVPGPIMSRPSGATSSSSRPEAVSLKLLSSSRVNNNAGTVKPSTPPETAVNDYFSNPPE